jgi:iron complex outermembrane receptor protein
MNQVSGHFDWSLTDQLSMAAKLYYNKYSDSRWVTFSSFQTQQERVTNESHHGALATMTWRPKLEFLHNFALEGGLSKEWQDNESRRYNTANRVRTAQTRDQQFDFDITGGYVQAIIEPTSWLKLVPAYRADRVDGDYTNHLNGRNYDVNDYGLIKQPKFSVVVSPSNSYSLYGNWGRTFQIGVGTGAYKVNQANDLEPSINEGWEAGIKFQPTSWMDGRVAFWEQRAENEARRKLGDPSNDSENIGKTHREGVDVQVNLRPMDNLAVWFAYSWQDSEILKADAASPTTEGQEIDHVPHYLLTSGIDWQATADWKFGLLARAQGDAYIERENIHGKFGKFLLFDASANYQWNDKVSLDFQVKNLTDREYEYVWWNTTPNPDISMHAPGDGRAAYLGVNLKL